MNNSMSFWRNSRAFTIQEKDICFVLLTLDSSYMKDAAAFADIFVHFGHPRMSIAFGYLCLATSFVLHILLNDVFLDSLFM